MTVLITGGGGMLAQDLARAAAAAGLEYGAPSRSELDITDPVAVREAIARVRPSVVINCAAWTDVDGAEEEFDAALAVNGDAAGMLAGVATEAGAWTIHISSDYVFDGAKREPYTESDPTGPLSGYGRSKLTGERAVAREAPESHTVIRSSWLFGAGGPCFPATILRLASERDELKIVDDQVGCPTFTGDLAEALVGLAGGTPPLGILHVAGAGSCSWYEFALAIVAQAGLDCEVKRCSTAEMPRPARRPSYSVLGTERGGEAPALAHWRDGLGQYMTAGEVAR